MMDGWVSGMGRACVRYLEKTTKARARFLFDTIRDRKTRRPNDVTNKRPERVSTTESRFDLRAMGMLRGTFHRRNRRKTKHFNRKLQ